VLAFEAGGGYGAFKTAGVADEGVFVGVEVEGQEATRANGLPTTMVANGEGGRATTVMENHDLGF